MLKPRIIPCLLLADDGLVKTIKFKAPRYVGDPVNVINIFNQLEADEIVLLDIMATRQGRKPPFEMIERIASECTAPLAYGGALTALDDLRRIFYIGVEKVVINTQAAADPRFVERASAAFGAQSIIASIDVKRGLLGRPQVWVRGATEPTKIDPVSYAKQMESAGAGELFLTSVDRDGTMEGYDLDLIRSVCQAVKIPVIACGGAGTRAHLADPIKRAGASAAAAGSLFVYQGQVRGVLINFPSQKQIREILR